MNEGAQQHVFQPEGKKDLKEKRAFYFILFFSIIILIHENPESSIKETTCCVDLPKQEIPK